jgi:protein O-GlcNAc transferase
MHDEPIDMIDKKHYAAIEHRPRLKQLLQGESGLEISLAGEALPGTLLEINELLRSGQCEEAKARFDEDLLHVIQGCVDNDPGCTDIMYIAARLLLEIGQPAPAERFLRMILERETHPVVLADLARLIQQDAMRSSEARIYWQQAWDLAPNKLEYLLAYASCVRDIGDVQEAVLLLERAILMEPGHGSLELSRLWSMNYLPGYDRSDLHARATQWASQYAAGISGYSAYENEASSTKKLKVGILSGDFMENSPMTFHEPALTAMNREAFELYAYSSVDAPNIGTARFEALFDVFRDIHELSEPDVAAQIRQDGIDILIAFGGHCNRHRLGVIVLRPAPVQVDWSALCSLGLPQIDYRITDDVLDPPEMQPYHTEELVYLSGGFVTYRPPEESPPVGPLPAQSNGYFTFGSFNSHLKINNQVLDMWTQILQRVPNARLVLKFLGAPDAGVREHLIKRFQACGVDTDRIRILGRTSHFDHLCLLGQSDLLLDCYPFNGYRTTLEGLWMGVPTISLSGTTHVSRMGLAVMRQLGWDAAFVAHTPQEYVDRACAYAEQLDELACIRGALRDLLLSSSICDPVRFARSLEGAFQYMWRQWCDKQNTGEKTAV